MTLWLDAQLSPVLAKWIKNHFNINAVAIRDLGLTNASDFEIFEKAKEGNVVVMTKDKDFVDLLDQKGPPPKIIWVTCGNTSNRHLQRILKKSLQNSIKFIASNEPLVEIGDPWS